jgi:hemolysin activation/secretion protein
MDINVKVTLDAAPAFMAVLQGLFKPLAGGGTASTPAPTVSSKNKLKNSDKVEKTATPEPEPAADPAPEAADTTEAVDEVDAPDEVEPSVTIEQIRALIPGAKAKVGTDKVKALLTKYDTANVTNLPKAKYDEFYNELKNLAA